MGHDGPRQTFLLAPGELGANRDVPDQLPLNFRLPDHRSFDRSPVSDVELDAGKSLFAGADIDDIGHVKNGRLTRRNPVTHRRGTCGMDHGKRLERREMTDNRETLFSSIQGKKSHK